MKLQIAFRETAERNRGHDMVIAVGLIETSASDKLDYEEKSLNFNFVFKPSSPVPLAVVCLKNPRPILGEGYMDDRLALGTLENFITVKMPMTVPDAMQNAEFVLRRTAMEASEAGGRVFAFAGLLHVRPGQPLSPSEVLQFESVGTPEEVMAYAGSIGRDLRPELGPIDMVEEMSGCDLSGFLKTPIWGFGEEAMRLPGTLRLSIYEDMERYADLYFAKELTDEERAEYDDLSARMRWCGLDTLGRDGILRECMRRMREMSPGLRSYRPESMAEFESRNKLKSAVIENLIYEQEAGRQYAR